eukprot:PhM_4_TR1335/c2_g1_i1/m.48689
MPDFRMVVFCVMDTDAEGTSCSDRGPRRTTDAAFTAIWVAFFSLLVMPTVSPSTTAEHTTSSSHVRNDISTGFSNCTTDWAYVCASFSPLKSAGPVYETCVTVASNLGRTCSGTTTFSASPGCVRGLACTVSFGRSHGHAKPRGTRGLDTKMGIDSSGKRSVASPSREVSSSSSFVMLTCVTSYAKPPSSPMRLRALTAAQRTCTPSLFTRFDSRTTSTPSRNTSTRVSVAAAPVATGFAFSLSRRKTPSCASSAAGPESTLESCNMNCETHSTVSRDIVTVAVPPTATLCFFPISASAGFT